MNWFVTYILSSAFNISDRYWFYIFCLKNYRQSIDMYSSVTSPNIGFLGTPASLSRLGSSFLSSTLTRRHTPEIFPNLIEPLIPSESQRQSSADYLPLPLPSQKSSSLRPSFHEPKIAKGVHEFPVSMQCSYGQAVLNGKLFYSIVPI